MSNAPSAYSLCILVFIQPTSDSDVADAREKWHRDRASEVALCSQTSQVRLCPLSLGCSDTSWHLPASALGRNAACPKGKGRAVYCWENPRRYLKSKCLVTRRAPQNLLAGGIYITTGPGGLEVQVSHSIAFVGDNFLPHFAPPPLPASHKGLPRKHRSILEHLGSALNSSCPQEQPDKPISCKCLSSKLSQQQLFAGAFYLPSGFLTL